MGPALVQAVDVDKRGDAGTGGAVAPWVPRLDRKVTLGLVIVGVFLVVAVLAPVLSPYPPNEQNILNRLASPSQAHWLGTDQLGRDDLSRLLYAARVDIPLAFVLVLLPALVGTAVGAFAGYFRGRTDAVTMRLAELVQAFPAYIFIIALVAALSPGPRSIIIAFVVLGWVIYARITRNAVLRVRVQDYVAAARVSGLPNRRVLFRHVLPNALNQVVAYLPADVVLALVGLSSLSFLGVGIQPPTAEWGAMISDGQPFITTNWWLVTVPGLAIVLFGGGLMLIADSLDDRLRRG